MMCPSRNKQDTEILIDYCAGDLDAVRAAEFDLHVAQCRECAELAAAQKAAWAALDQWTSAEISSDFDERLYARIAQERQAPAWKRTVNRWMAAARESLLMPGIWKPALGGAVACAALAVAFLVHAPRVADPPASGNPTSSASRSVEAPRRAEAVDMEQVEHALDDLDLLTPASSNRL